MNNVESIFFQVGDIVMNEKNELCVVTNLLSTDLHAITSGHIWVYNFDKGVAIMVEKSHLQYKDNAKALYQEKNMWRNFGEECKEEREKLKAEIEHLKNDLEYVKDSRDLWKKLAQGDHSTGYDLLKAKLDYDAYEAKLYEDHRIKFSHDI